MSTPLWLQDLGLRLRATSPTLERTLYSTYNGEVSALAASDYELSRRLYEAWLDIWKGGGTLPTDAAYTLLVLRLSEHAMAEMMIRARPTLVLPEAPPSIRAYARHVQKTCPSDWWAQVTLRTAPSPASRVHVRFSTEDAAWLQQQAVAANTTPQDVVRSVVAAARVNHAG